MENYSQLCDEILTLRQELGKNDLCITSVFNIRCNRLLNVSHRDSLFLGYRKDEEDAYDDCNPINYDLPTGLTDKDGPIVLSSSNIAEFSARLYKCAYSIRDVLNRQLRESNLFIDGTGVM